MQVLIAGGGIGGLALAQGLGQAGVDVHVYERDASARFRGQGYRLHIDDNGGEALRYCLPDPLFRLYLATSNRSEGPRINILDTELNEMFTQDLAGSGFDPETAHTAVNRLTLRQVLLTGLDKSVHFGHEIVDVQRTVTGAALRFADGSNAHGDAVIIADGVGSGTARRWFPDRAPVDTGLRIVYGKTLLTEENIEWLPAPFFDGFSAVFEPTGRAMVAGMMRQRQPVSAAVRALAPDVVVDPFDDYLMWATCAPQSTFPLSDEDLARTEPKALQQAALGFTEGWHPALARIIREAATESLFPLHIRTFVDVPELPEAPVTLLGDAVHAMPPNGGVGANTALRDAALLTEQLSLVAAGKAELLPALSKYAHHMREYATEAIHTSLRSASLEHLVP